MNYQGEKKGSSVDRRKKWKWQQPARERNEAGVYMGVFSCAHLRGKVEPDRYGYEGIIRCIVQGRWLAPPSALETLDNLVEGVMAPFWRHY